MGKYQKYNDADLIKAMQSSTKRIQEEAFLELYNRYNRHVYLYISKIINNSEVVNDLFQDVFLKFINMIQKGVSLENVRNMLIVIARNTCLNHKKKKTESYVDGIEEMLIAEDSYKDENDLVRVLQKGLELLDEDKRELILLKYYDGLSYEELTEITGIPYNTLKNMVYRAKYKLKSILAPYLKEINKEIEN
ncbi:MAG TPA: RNA polymerase sigma factor [Candidatus Kapabacteria bacterium]|nr:RNA polymerase sigma factor [Candidatus Kapabacteria bacterium]